MKPKYNIKIQDLEQRHNVQKLEQDGFNREKIIESMYKLTDGMPQSQRTDLINKLYDRSEK